MHDISISRLSTVVPVDLRKPNFGVCLDLVETFATLKMKISPDNFQHLIGSEGQQEESSSCPRTAPTFLSTDGSSPIVHLPKAVDNASFNAQL